MLLNYLGLNLNLPINTYYLVSIFLKTLIPANIQRPSKQLARRRQQTVLSLASCTAGVGLKFGRRQMFSVG